MRKELPKYLWTSDWHIGDKNILSYDNRPFRTLEHQNRELVKRFNSIARSQDTTFFVGDMGRGIRDIIPKLNGNKILVVGNHDHIGTYSALQLGFSAVLYSATIYLGSTLITITHCPLRGVFREDVSEMKNSKPGEYWHGESRHQRFSIEDQGQFHIHGHTHKDTKDAILGKQMDIGVRAHNYFPVTTSFVESWIAKSSRSHDDQQGCNTTNKETTK